MVDFEWDPAKDTENQAKHGIGFDEAKILFSSGVEYLEIYDTDHSQAEDRFIAVGPVARGLVCVVYTDRDDRIRRLISARFATQREQQLFVKFIAETG